MTRRVSDGSGVRYDAGVSRSVETTEQGISHGGLSSRDAAAPDPGLLLVFTAGQPVARVVPIDGVLELGRTHPIFDGRADARISRLHARVTVEGRDLVVRDLGSRNGTFVDGETVRPDAPRRLTRCLRVGDSIFLPCQRSAATARLGVRRNAGRVEGPALQQVVASVEKAALLGRTLLVVGESGAGKEALARAFHAAGPASSGPFIAVNCAAIPESVAERLLFGAKRGAYSGAHADADGYVQAAAGGTLFLDEVAELDQRVQAKLLRLLETGEVLPLGAARPRALDLRFCSATHRDLRALSAAGKLREDLYHRIAHPRVVVPPLRDRPEEIPWLLHGEIAATAPELALHLSLVEACLLRPWPGNVRELLAEARAAAQAARLGGQARVEACHLDSTAGASFSGDEPAVAATRGAPDRTKIQRVLVACGGNVSAAARTLGVQRTQLRRWLARLDGGDASAATGGDEEPDLPRVSAPSSAGPPRATGHAPDAEED